MFKKLIKNKKAQNTAEYAILISLVVAGIIAMQTYAQRALQARVRDAASYLKNTTSDLGTSVQYEPYYLDTDYTITRTATDEKFLSNALTGVGQRATDTSSRTGAQLSSYNATAFGEQF